MACFVNSLQNYGLFLICANIFCKKNAFFVGLLQKRQFMAILSLVKRQ